MIVDEIKLYNPDILTMQGKKAVETYDNADTIARRIG
jgi:hypothetical protein